jgi:propionyl-CoA synthetase
MNETQIRNI